MMTLQDILRRKGGDVYSIEPNATIAEAVRSMVDKCCGSLVVRDTSNEGSMVGIITERDILRTTANLDRPFNKICVSEVMTVDVITASPSDTVTSLMGKMTEKRIRHLPIFEDGELKGIISIGDVVKAQFELLAMENHYLKEYIQS